MNRIADAADYPVYIWFQSSKRPDAILTLKKTNDQIYKVVLKDNLMNDKTFNMYFNSYADLCKYLDLYFDNILLDQDEHTPFEFVQWNIPGFTTTILNLRDIHDNYIYRTFTDCLNVFFSQ